MSFFSYDFHYTKETIYISVSFFLVVVYYYWFCLLKKKKRFVSRNDEISERTDRTGIRKYDRICGARLQQSMSHDPIEIISKLVIENNRIFFHETFQYVMI